MNELIKGFGSQAPRERKEALKLLNALDSGKIKELANSIFNESTAEIYYNPNSDYVFLSDEDYNTLMLDDEGLLYLFISTPYEGIEGSFEEIMEQWDNLHSEDKEYMFDIATEELKKTYYEEFKEVYNKNFLKED